MSMMKVDYTGGIGFNVSARNHQVLADLPQDKGGQDKGMTPPELFMASLGSCIGVYVVRYCQNAKLDVSGLGIELDWKLSDDKTKISEISVVMGLPSADVGRREAAVLQAAHHCLVHNTIFGNPQIHIALVKR
jgi:putative redox protein